MTLCSSVDTLSSGSVTISSGVFAWRESVDSFEHAVETTGKQPPLNSTVMQNNLQMCKPKQLITLNLKKKKKYGMHILYGAHE